MTRNCKQALADAGIDQLDAELLLAHVLEKPREFVVANPNNSLSWFDWWRFQQLVKKRKQHIPLAYLTGHQAFFGLDFVVNKHTLVPRPDTELLVERAIELLAGKDNMTLIDVGTGSGAIPIAVERSVKRQLPVYATDISKSALRVAKMNAMKHGMNINFLHGNLLIPAIKIKAIRKNVLLTANLPYLTEEQYANEKSIQQEPKLALVAKKSGLALISELLEQIQYAKIAHATILLEYDPSQTSSLKKLIVETFPNAYVRIHKDLAERDRVCEITL